VTPLLAVFVWGAGIVGWYVIRIPHEKRSRRTPVAQKPHPVREKILLSVSICGILVIPAIYVASGEPRFADYSFEPVLAWLGAVVFALSLALFYRTHRDLQQFWSVTLEIRETHRLVTSGVYRYVRHPMYAAFFLWGLAQALLLPNWIAGPAGIAGFGTLFCFRLRREEQMMEATFGDAYRAYAARTWRVLPGIF